MEGSGPTLVEQFLEYERSERRRSPLTVQSYGKDLASFEAYLQERGDGLDVATADRDLIRGWLESQMDKGNTATTVNRRLSALHTFYRFALSNGMVERDPSYGLRGPKKAKLLPSYLKEKEADELLDAALRGEGTYKEACVHAIVTVFYETGIRISELVGLDDADVDTEAMQLKVTGKGNKQRVVPFGDGLAEAIESYRVVRARLEGRDAKAMFVTEKGQRVTASQVRYEVKKEISKVSTLKKRTPHVLRHTFATAMLNHGAGIESIKKLLGHESVSTTEIYTHTTFEQLKRVYKQAHPRA